MYVSPIRPIPAVMTTDQVAKLLHCPPQTVERYVHAHELVAIMIGKERRIRAEDLLEFLASRPASAKSRRLHRTAGRRSLS